MEDFVSFFLVIVCITIFYIYLETKALAVTYVKSKSKNTFLVRNLPDKDKAAELLNEIRDRLSKIVEHVKTQNDVEKEDVDRLVKNYRPDNISESSPGNKYTSYSINKGEKLVFCIRSKDEHAKLVEINTMMFVAIHELAHIGSEQIGHGDEFWKNFKFLLQRAVEIKVYDPIDYKNKPKRYCSMDIHDNPLYDL
jgi:predicted metal-dependent hydrolase